MTAALTLTVEGGMPAPSPWARELHQLMVAFMRDRVLPAEHEYEACRATAGPDDHSVPPVVEDLKREARALGLWNLFLPAASGLTQLEYAPLAELSGWSHDIAPEAINCQAPDTGNMELLHLFGTGDQQRDWLQPLLDGRIRSAFAMTEPDVASSDATNIATRIVRDGDEYVVAVPRAVARVLDCAIQVHGGAGVSDDIPLAAMWGWYRAMRLFDGPDEVHLPSLGRTELRR